MRRLAAMAPAELSEDDDADADRRPLRERVRDRAGIADLLMFRIGDELFATDLASVEEAMTSRPRSTTSPRCRPRCSASSPARPR